MKAFLSGVVLTLLLLVGIGVVAVSGGYINISAAGSEASLLRWFLHSVYERTVEERAADISVPADLSGEARIEDGARSFDSMCRGCHTPPGQASTAVHIGLNPQPPELRELMHQLSAAEAFWVIDNGVRMTGMPAFGESHSDEQLWSIVAFLQAARNLDADAYREIVSKARAAQDAGDHDGHDHRHMNEPSGDDTGNSSPPPPVTEPEQETERNGQVEEEEAHDHSSHEH